jgi:hypothetical protein
MALTLPKMGLRVWNQQTDPYDHTQLADNWAKVDYHDHSSGKGVQIPTGGIADGAITSPKLASNLDPSGAFTSFKGIVRLGGSPAAAAAAGTYPLRQDFGTIVTLPSIAANSAFYLDPDDFLATGRTTKYRTRGYVITNAVAPTATYAISLFPVATWGGASGAAPTIATLGAAVAGSTLTFAAPALGGPTVVQMAEFDPPIAGVIVSLLYRQAQRQPDLFRQ